MTITPPLTEKTTYTAADFDFLQDPKDKSAKLGTGSFATVKLAREKKTGKLIALKMVSLENSKNRAADLQNLKIETNIHSRMEHQNIIQYHGYFRDEPNVYIVLEYAAKGNLYVYSQKRQALTQREIFRYFFQTVLAIQYLHQRDVMHRDIKPENLLLDENMNIKLCDFGWSTERIKEKRTTFCGTYEYMAPEIVYKRPYDYRVDIWSLGILLFELIHKEAPYKGRSLSEIWKSLSKGTITYSSSLDPEAKDLIHRILKLIPEERLSIAQIISHPWVQRQLDKDNDLTSMYKVSYKVDKPLDIETKFDTPLSVRKKSVKLVANPTADKLQVKTRQLSECQRKLPLALEENSSESSIANQTKSSFSLAKAIVERFDSEEDAPTVSSPRKNKFLGSKMVSENLKRTLGSGKPTTLFNLNQEMDITPKGSNSIASIGFLPGPGSSSGLYNTYSIGTGRSHGISAIGPITPTTTFRNPGTLSNLPTPTSNDRSAPGSAFFPDTAPNASIGKKLPLLFSSHKSNNSAQLGGTGIAFRTVDNTAANTGLYQKTRALVDETEITKKNPLELTRSISTEVKSQMNFRPLESPTSFLEQQPKASFGNTMRGVVSPMGIPKRDFFRRTNSDMPKIEAFIKENGLATPSGKAEIMTRRPSKGPEAKLRVEEVMTSSTKITKEDFNRTIIIKTREQNGNSVRIVRPFMKGSKAEGKEEKVDKVKASFNSGALEQNITPRSYNFRLISN